jgi:GNAT superfamily N-acetyltransferase
MNMAQATGHAYALLADGSTVQIRPAGPADFAAVKALHEAISPDNIYLRFFSLSKLAAETEARRLCQEPRPGHASLLALSAGEVVGCASYDASGGPEAPGNVAEVAFAVADHMHHRGIATLLLEHLVSSGRSHQVTGSPRRPWLRTPRCSGCSPALACRFRVTTRAGSWS